MLQLNRRHIEFRTQLLRMILMELSVGFGDKDDAAFIAIPDTNSVSGTVS